MVDGKKEEWETFDDVDETVTINSKQYRLTGFLRENDDGSVEHNSLLFEKIEE